VCGAPRIDLNVLRRHTVYAPKRFTDSSPAVQQFWNVLQSFTEHERGLFLSFAWARSRLPAVGADDDPRDTSWRMKLNILDIGQGVRENDAPLPTSETCFFNVNLPAYGTVDIMRRKLLSAISNCQTITS